MLFIRIKTRDSVGWGFISALCVCVWIWHTLNQHHHSYFPSSDPLRLPANLWKHPLITRRMSPDDGPLCHPVVSRRPQVCQRHPCHLCHTVHFKLSALRFSLFSEGLLRQLEGERKKKTSFIQIHVEPKRLIYLPSVTDSCSSSSKEMHDPRWTPATILYICRHTFVPL